MTRGELGLSGLGGRITSAAPATNRFGVPLARVLEISEENHRAEAERLRLVIKKFLAADRAKKSFRPNAVVKALQDDAVEAATVALL